MGTALVLSGGGMFAAWAAGAWRALYQSFKPDLIIGTSAGALNGWLIAGGATPNDLSDAWLDPAVAKIFRPTLHGKALSAKTRELADRYRPQIPFGLTVTEFPNLRARLFLDGEITWRHLAAACSVPVVFPPVKIGDKRYFDGGFRSALPLWAAEQMGATRAIGLNCLNTLPFRVLRKVLRPRQPSKALDVLVIEPSEWLGSLRDASVWSRANIERWIELGENDGHRAASSFTM
jgi:NTE family protein